MTWRSIFARPPDWDELLEQLPAGSPRLSTVNDSKKG